MLPLLLALGLWQLDREAGKRALLNAYQSRAAAPAVPLGSLPVPPEAFTRVVLQGQFLPQWWRLGPRIRHGQQGEEILQGFALDAGGQVLVNRGWQPAGRLPDAPGGTLRLSTSVHHTATQLEVRACTQARDACQVVSEGLPDGPWYPALFRLEPDAPGALQAQWVVTAMPPERHRGYAVQWFGLALALCICNLFAHSNLGQRWRRTQ